jgi:hypothetical protein
LKILVKMAHNVNQNFQYLLELDKEFNGDKNRLCLNGEYIGHHPTLLVAAKSLDAIFT